MKFSRFVILPLFITLLAGCAQPVKKQAFNAEIAGSVKTIVIAHGPNQDEYPAIVIAHPGASFGLIGGLVAAADIKTKSTKLTTAIDVKETRLQERFASILQQKLIAIGYTTTVVVLKSDTKPEQVLDQVRSLNAIKDGVLIVDIFGAYTAAGPKSDYFPRIAVNVKKLDGLKGDILYQDTFTYGYTGQAQQTVHVASDEKYRFADIEVLTENAMKTRQGLLDGLESIATHIANDLKK